MSEQPGQESRQPVASGSGRAPEPGRPDDRPIAGRPVGRFAMNPQGGSSAGAFAGLGIQFALSIIVFLYAGQWLDRRLGTEPWLLLLFVFGGAGASFYSLYRRLMAAQEREEQERRAARDARERKP